MMVINIIMNIINAGVLVNILCQKYNIIIPNSSEVAIRCSSHIRVLSNIENEIIHKLNISLSIISFSFPLFLNVNAII